MTPKSPNFNSNIQILINAAKKLGLSYKILETEKWKVRFWKGKKSFIITKKSMGLNDTRGIQIARDKHKTYLALKKAHLPILPQIVIKNQKEYQKKAKPIPFPQVIKSQTGKKGKDIYLNIKNIKEGVEAVKKVLLKTNSCIIEPYFKARDYRFIVLAGKIIGICQRKPPQITADGKHNLKKLIEIENERRLKLNQKLGKRMLNRMLIWERIDWYLKNQNLSFKTIPKKGKIITLYPIPNFSTGGSVEAIDKKAIHPSYLHLAEKTAKVVGLTITGVDILIKNFKKPATAKNCAIIEVNSDPGLRLHDWPNKGKPQNVAEKILKYILSNLSH